MISFQDFYNLLTVQPSEDDYSERLTKLASLLKSGELASVDRFENLPPLCDYCFYSPLTQAAAADNLPAVRMLLAAGADPELLDQLDRSALDCCDDGHTGDMIAELLEKAILAKRAAIEAGEIRASCSDIFTPAQRKAFAL